MSAGSHALLAYDDVTPEWVSQALQAAAPGVVVNTVSRGPILGYKQNKFRIDVRYAQGDADLPASFLVKGNFPGQSDPATGSAWAMAAELRSIRDVVKLIAAPAVPIWYRIDIGTEASSILMEDLTARKVHFFTAHRTLDLGQAMSFIDAFARMHASRWNSPDFAPGGAMGPDSFAGQNRHLLNNMYCPTFFMPDNWHRYIALPRGSALPAAFQDIDRAQRAWGRMWAVLAQADMTIIHGDEHLGNLYVTAEGKAGLIDWFARPEHWPIGIAYFMLCTLDVIDRRRWERPLLSHYVKRLATYGVANAPSLDDAWFFYRCAAFYPVMTWLNNSGVWQPEAANTANVVRAATAAIDLDTFPLLGV